MKNAPGVKIVPDVEIRRVYEVEMPEFVYGDEMQEGDDEVSFLQIEVGFIFHPAAPGRPSDEGYITHSVKNRDDGDFTLYNVEAFSRGRDHVAAMPHYEVNDRQWARVVEDIYRQIHLEFESRTELVA